MHNTFTAQSVIVTAGIKKKKFLKKNTILPESSE